MTELKSWDTLGMVESDAEKAIKEHDAAIAGLYRNGKPIYSDDIMREKAKAARATLTASLDRCKERAQAFQVRAEAKAAAGQGDPYTWLTTEELQRAAMLRPFIVEDAASEGAQGLAQLARQVTTGKRKIDKSTAFLLAREAAKVDAPRDAFMNIIMPPEIAEAEAEAAKARKLANEIDMSRPEYQEHIQRDIMRNANYDHTGKPIDA